MRERGILDRLHQRYSQTHGNGPRYVCAEHVKNGSGFDAERCADMLVQDLWPSKGLALHGHEVKVSRSDWLTELRHPEKAAAFTPYVDYWWLAVSDPSIVGDGELPDGWGLLVPLDGLGGARMRVARQARRRVDVQPMPRTMTAAFLRAAVKTAQRRAEREAAA